jgi:hypothetical protein
MILELEILWEFRLTMFGLSLNQQQELQECVFFPYTNHQWSNLDTYTAAPQTPVKGKPITLPPSLVPVTSMENPM